MGPNRRSFLYGGAASLLAFNQSWAQAWPNRAITLLNPFAAGGQSDAIGRIIASHLQSVLDQPVLFESRVGAGGTVGAQVVAKAAPDGHTILFGTTSTYTVAPAVFRNAGYDPTKSFAPVTIATEGAMVLCTHPDRQFKTVAELIAAAKARPGTITYASAGIGSLPHVLAEYLAFEAGTKFVHVPYRGGAPAMNDLIGGQIDLMFEQIANVSQNAAAGRIRPLFHTGTSTSPLLPQTPTAAQATLPSLSLTSWTGLAAPHGTPQIVIDRLVAEVKTALSTTEARELTEKLGVSVVASGANDMRERIARELAIYRQVATSAGIAVD